jgi:hydrogenase/urease accessory protein HupE
MKTDQFIIVMSILFVIFVVMAWVTSFIDLPYKGIMILVQIACFGALIYIAVRLHYRLFHRRTAP